MRSDFQSPGRSSRLLFALALFGAALCLAPLVAAPAHAQATAPGAPTALMAEGGVDMITLTWTAPTVTGDSAITGYQIESAPDESGGAGAFTVLEDDTESTATTFMHTGLGRGETMHYRVSAINGAGPGDASNEASGTTFDVPDAPGVIGVTQGAGMLTLTWAAPAEDGGSPVTGYRIESAPDMGGSAGAFTDLVADTESTATTYMHTELGAGETVYYRVSAINEVGTGAALTSSATTTFDVPGAPTALAAQRGTGMITLTWVEPADNGGSPVTGYRIESAPDMDGSAGDFTDLVADTENTDTTYMHTGLDAGETVHYRVSAISAAGTGAASGEVSGSAFDVPGAPTGLMAARGEGVITLTWTAPGDGGSPITGYRIESAPDESGSAGTFTELEGDTGNTDLTYMHTGLSAGETVHYRVSAINGVGTGAASGEASGTSFDVPGAPTALMAARGVGVITLTWTAPGDGGSPITGYQIESSPDGADATFTDLAPNTMNTDVTYMHSGLSAGETVYYRVSAINAVGTGEASASTSAATAEAPGPVTGLSGERGVSSIVLTWTAPAEAGGSAISGYRIEFSATGDAGGFGELEDDTGNTDVTYTHSGLGAGQSVYYRVSAINAAGTGPASEQIGVTTVEPSNAPTELMAQRGVGSITLAWTAPTDSGGSEVTSYRVESAPDVNGSAGTFTILADDTGSTDPTYTHSGLSAGAALHYRVRALTELGAGQASESIMATSATAPVDAPGGLTAVRGAEAGTIVLTWTAPEDDGGDAVIAYRIRSSPNAADAGFTDLVANTGNTDTTYTHTGLAPDQRVHYKVSAINGVGAGTESGQASATAPGIPGAPTGLSLQRGVDSITLTWKAPEIDGGAPLTGYRVEHSPDGSAGSFTAIDTESTDITYTHEGITDDQPVHFRVSATNALGTGPPSLTLSDSRATAPGAPTMLLVQSEGGIQQLVLTWTAPGDGGSPITGYRVESSPDDGASGWDVVEENTGSAAASYTHTGLSVDATVYHYRVSAINAVGTGPASNSANGTTEQVVNALSDQEALEFTLEIMGRALATDMVNVLSNRFDAFDAPQESMRLTARGRDLPLGAHRSEGGGMNARLRKLAGVFGIEAQAADAPSAGRAGHADVMGRSNFGASPGWMDVALQNPSLGFGDTAPGMSAFGGPAASLAGVSGVSGVSNAPGQAASLSFSPDALLDGGAFSWRPGAATSALGAANNAAGGEADGVWTVWWRGSQALFKARRDERGANGFSIDGDVLSGYLGMDVHWNRKWLTGVALSYGRAEVEYGSSARGSDGTWEIDMLTFLPYLRWSPREDLHLFGMVGIGFGESEFADTLVDPGDTDLDLRMAAVGVKNELASIGRIDLAMKADYLSVGMESAATHLLPEGSVTTERARLMLSGDTRWQPRENAGYSVETNFELGVRVDGGEHETGSGTELGVGISYTYPEHGLQFALKGRVLLAHTHGDYRERGITLTADFDPGVRDSGLYLSLRPSWGKADTDMDAFTNAEGGAFSGDALSRSARSARGRFDLGIGYGIAVNGGGARLTPFAEWGRDSAAHTERVRLGLRFALLERAAARALDLGELRTLELRLFGEQRSRNAQPSEQHIGLGVNLEF